MRYGISIGIAIVAATAAFRFTVLIEHPGPRVLAGLDTPRALRRQEPSPLRARPMHEPELGQGLRGFGQLAARYSAPQEDERP